MDAEELQELRNDPLKFMEWLQKNPNTHFVLGKRRRQLGFNSIEFRAACVIDTLRQGLNIMVLGLKPEGLSMIEWNLQAACVEYTLETVYSDSDKLGRRPPAMIGDEMYEYFIPPSVLKLIEADQFKEKVEEVKIIGYRFIPKDKASALSSRAGLENRDGS